MFNIERIRRFGNTAIRSIPPKEPEVSKHEFNYRIIIFINGLNSCINELYNCIHYYILILGIYNFQHPYSLRGDMVLQIRLR